VRQIIRSQQIWELLVRIANIGTTLKMLGSHWYRYHWKYPRTTII